MRKREKNRLYKITKKGEYNLVKRDMVIYFKIVYYNGILYLWLRINRIIFLGGKRNGKFIVEEYQQDLSERLCCR